MKKIKFFPAPHVGVSVTDEMIADLKECERMAEETNYEGCKYCNTCSWGEVEIESIGICEMEEVCRQVLEEERKCKD